MRIPLYLSLHLHAIEFVNKCKYLNTHVYTNVLVYVCVCARARVRVWVCARACVCVNTFMYILIHMY